MQQHFNQKTSTATPATVNETEGVRFQSFPHKITSNRLFFQLNNEATGELGCFQLPETLQHEAEHCNAEK